LKLYMFQCLNEKKNYDMLTYSYTYVSMHKFMFRVSFILLLYKDTLYYTALSLFTVTKDGVRIDNWIQ
jgi:hypothetical protein